MLTTRVVTCLVTNEGLTWRPCDPQIAIKAIIDACKQDTETAAQLIADLIQEDQINAFDLRSNF